MAFFESPRFPEAILYGSSGGPSFKTDVIVIDSGYEQANQKWSYPRYAFDASMVRKEEDLEDLIAFFQVAAGKANGFRFKDSYDYKSCALSSSIAYTDQNIGSGDGTTAAFQLRKAYTQGANTQYRLIKKPVAGTVVVGITNPITGTFSALASEFSVDTTTGVVTWQDHQSSVVTAVDQGGSVLRITASSHNIALNETAYLSAFTGDWAALNGERHTVINRSSTWFEISYDASSFAAYSGNGGEVDTLPQTGESVFAGFEFDVPVRFDTDTLSTSWEAYRLGTVSVPLVELRL